MSVAPTRTGHRDTEGGLVWEARGHSQTALAAQDGSLYLMTFALANGYDGIAATTKVRR